MTAAAHPVNLVIAFEVSDKPSAVFLTRDGTLNVKAEEGCT